MSMLRRISIAVSLFFLAMLVFTPTLSAQLSTRATIIGTVTDSSGAVVPGASVTITDDSTKVAITTQTNGSGVYIASGLNVSTYTVTIAKAGFKNYTVTGVRTAPYRDGRSERSAYGRRCHPDRVRRGSLHHGGDFHSRGFDLD